MEEEVYKKALRQQYLQQNYVSGDVNLDKFLRTSVASNDKGKYIFGKRKDSGDFFNLGSQDVNFHKIIIEKHSNKNKACMCKPVADMCQIRSNTRLSMPRNSKLGLDSRSIYIDTELKTTDAVNQTSRQCIILNDYTIESEEATLNGNNGECNCVCDNNGYKTKLYKQTSKYQPSTSNSRISVKAKISVSPNLEQNEQESGDPEAEFVCCKKKVCSCGPCVVEEEEKLLECNIQKNKNSCCTCGKKKLKKKCFPFIKRNKDVDIDKCIQVKRIGFADTCGPCGPCRSCVKDRIEVSPCKPCNIDPDEEADKISVCRGRSIWLCSKCGKISSNSCKKCCKSSCTNNNTIVLPPKSSASPGDHVDTLRMLIKMEAKQNYRQVNFILQELNEQKNEIKKLNEMFLDLIKNTPGKFDKTESQCRRICFGNCPVQRQSICERCGLYFYKDMLKATNSKIGGVQSFENTKRDPTDEPQNENVQNENNQNEAIQNIDSNKYLKNIINKSKKSGDTICNEINKTIQKVTQPDITPKNSDHSESEKDSLNKKSQVSVLTLFLENINKEQTSKVNLKAEIPATAYEKLCEEKQLNEKVFSNSTSSKLVSWCKQSPLSIREKENLRLKKYNKNIQKRSECQKVCKTRPRRTICDCFAQLCKYIFL